MSQLSHVFPAGAYPAAGYVRLEGLACWRGLLPVFDNLTAEVKAGEALALYGANGSGKTSLLRILAGLLPPQAGAAATALGRCDVHYLGHADGLKSALTVSETCAMLAGFYAAPAFDEAALLAALGLAGRGAQTVGDLSAGQRRRLALARLLIAPRALWLLDEPLTALDASGRDLLAALAAAHLAAKGMIIAASHEPLSFASLRLDLDASKGGA